MTEKQHQRVKNKKNEGDKEKIQMEGKIKKWDKKRKQKC
jgi:hypothetical protein